MKGPKLLDNGEWSKRERLPSNEKEHVQIKPKVKGLSYEIENEELKDFKLPKQKRRKNEKDTLFESDDKEIPGCSNQ